MDNQVILRKLDNHLILRRSNISDTESLAQFNKGIHGEGFDEDFLLAWVRDLMSGKHPTFNIDDFTIVENEEDHKIVSSLNLISQTWSYAGIPFGVGRPELVGTLPDYRNRGLIREQFNVVHEWSRQRGEMMQIITGIPYYYRQYGYEMTLELGGSRFGYVSNLPPLAEGEVEPFHLRPATPEDIPFIRDLYNLSTKRSLISAVWTDEMWNHEMLEKDAKNINRRVLHIVEESQTGKPVGFIAAQSALWSDKMTASYYELVPGTNWRLATPVVLRYLVKLGKEATLRKNNVECLGYRLELGSEHPAYTIGMNSYLPIANPPYAYYVRIPDLPAFMRKIAPVLEDRLANSLMPGFSGNLALSFYRSGLKMTFKDGKLEDAQTFRPKPKEDVDAAFPDQTFLHLVCGHRTLSDLRTIYVDAFANDQARVLLEALFPRQHSLIWSIS